MIFLRLLCVVYFYFSSSFLLCAHFSLLLIDCVCIYLFLCFFSFLFFCCWIFTCFSFFFPSCYVKNVLWHAHLNKKLSNESPVVCLFKMWFSTFVKSRKRELVCRCRYKMMWVCMGAVFATRRLYQKLYETKLFLLSFSFAVRCVFCCLFVCSNIVFIKFFLFSSNHKFFFVVCSIANANCCLVH